MDGLPAETADVLGCLIAQSEAHRDEQMAVLHTLSGRGESTAEALQILGQIEDTLAAMRSRRANLQALQQLPGDRKSTLVIALTQANASSCSL